MKKLHKNKKHTAMFKVVLYTTENGTNNCGGNCTTGC
jgi:hypothetical protein